MLTSLIKGAGKTYKADDAENRNLRSKAPLSASPRHRAVDAAEFPENNTKGLCKTEKSKATHHNKGEYTAEEDH